MRNASRRLLVPSEDVRLQVVHLPIAGRQMRSQAAPFAIEDDLAEPLSELHVAIGPEVAPQRYLIGVVRHARMAEWVANFADGENARAPILPDALTVPLPETGHWSVRATGERALVRTDDGGGFAIALSQFADAWRLAGRPGVVSLGDPLPAGINLIGGKASGASRPDRVADSFDLRQGIYAANRSDARRTLGRLARLLLAGACVHVGLLFFEVMQLETLLQERRAEAASLLRGVAPSAPVDGDIAGTLVSLLPRDTGAPQESRFLPLLDGMSRALAGRPGNLVISGISYHRTEGVMSLTIEASDLAALQAVEAALAEAGLSPQSGAATVSDGAARATIRLSEGGR